MHPSSSRGPNGPPPTSHIIQHGRYEHIGVPFPLPMANVDVQLPLQTQNLLQTLAHALTNFQDRTTDRLEKLEMNLNGMVVAINENSRKDTINLAEYMERSHKIQMNATQRLLDRLEAVEGTLGNDPSLHGDETLTGRMQRIDCVVHELLEGISDPDATRRVTPMHDAAVNTSPSLPAKDLVDIGVDPIKLDHRLIDAGVDAPILTTVDVGIDATALIAPTDAMMGPESGHSTVQIRTFADAAISACIPADEDNESESGDGDSPPAPPSLSSFGVPMHTRFPTSPYKSDPLTPAQWSPKDASSSSSSERLSGSQTSSRELSYVDNYLARASSGTASASETPHRAVVAAQEEVHDGFAAADENFNMIVTELVAVVSPDPGAPIEIGPFTNAPRPPSIPPSAQNPFPSFEPPSRSTTPGAQTVSSPTVVDMSPTPRSPSPKSVASPVSNASSSPVPLALPRKRPAPDRALSTSPNARPLPPPIFIETGALQTQTQRSWRPVSFSESLSSLSSLTESSRAPSSAPLPPPPLPRRTHAALASSTPQAVKLTLKIKPSRSRNSSPEVQIIEKPAKIESTSRRKDKGKRKSRAKAGNDEEKNDLGRPRKKRKTDGAEAAAKSKRGPSRPRKTKSETISHSEAALVAESSSAAAWRDLDGEECIWPEKIEDDIAYQRQFVQCDNCDAWYHFGCVAMRADDPRLAAEDDGEFLCPPCELFPEQRNRRYVNAVEDASCRRPDCNHPGDPSENKEYFIERIIGRRPEIGDNSRTGHPRYLWLVKWDGWPVQDASWAHPVHLGDCTRYIEGFETAAGMEGHDLSDPWKKVVLNEAAAVNW